LSRTAILRATSVAIACLFTGAAQAAVTVRDARTKADLILSCVGKGAAIQATISLDGLRDDGELAGLMRSARFATLRTPGIGAAEDLGAAFQGVEDSKGRTLLRFRIESFAMLSGSRAFLPVVPPDAGRIQTQMFHEMAFDLSRHKAAISALVDECNSAA